MTFRILMLSPIDPFAHTSGEGERIEQLFRAINIDGFSAKVIHGDAQFSDRFDSFPTIISRYLYDLNPFLYYLLFRELTADNYDAIQVEGPRGVLAAKIVAKLVSFNNTPKIVLDSHNFEAGDAHRERSEDLNRVKRKLAPYVIIVFEHLSVRYADHILTVSEKDKQEFRNRYGISKENLTVIPSGSKQISDDEQHAGYSIKKKLSLPQDSVVVVFHGTYSYKPNKEAVTVIRTEIAPEIQNEEIQFVIAGGGVPDFPEKDIHGVGFVDNLYPFLQSCDIAAVPLQTGGGTKLKMFDYMACSLPIITTPQGVEGIKLSDGKSALIANSPNEFIQKIKNLSYNEDKRSTLGNQANRLFKKRYTWDSIKEQLRIFYHTSS